MVMKATGSETNKHATYIIDEKNTPFAITESFRSLMINVDFSIPKKENGKGKIFCVCSSVAGEGKTTVSVNLALSFARAGFKTIYVDCDMRRSYAKDLFNKTEKTKKGIVTYLVGQETIENVIRKDVESNLDALLCIQTAPNPINLINSDLFDRLLCDLESAYEYVIIDTPPIDVVSDTLLIAPKTDGVVFVTRQMYSDDKAIKEAIRKLKFANCSVLGFVMNGAKISGGGYYGKYKKYGYNYKSYGSDPKKQSKEKEKNDSQE